MPVSRLVRPLLALLPAFLLAISLPGPAAANPNTDYLTANKSSRAFM